MKYLSVRRALGAELLAAAVLLAAASSVLLVVARTSGPTRIMSEPVPFEERGTFEYGTRLGSGVYDGDQLQAPQPLFRRLGDQLPIRYRYALRSLVADHPVSDARGTYSLTAELRQGNGWVRSVVLVPQTAFAGGAVEANGVVNLAALSDMIRRLETETGYRSPTFRVRVVANIDASAILAGQLVTRSHHQVLDFRLSELELALDVEASNVDQRAAGDVTIEVPVRRYMTVPMTSVQVPYAELPRIAVGGLALSILLGLVVAVASFQERPPAVRERFVPNLIEVLEAAAPNGALPVPTLDDLMRAAERFGVPVVHVQGPREHYEVAIDGKCFLFEATSQAKLSVLNAIRRNPRRAA